MRFWLISLLLMVFSNVVGQEVHPFLHADTIKSDHRIGGKLDSIDVMFNVSSSTIPGGGVGFCGNVLPTNWFRSNPSAQRFFSYSGWSPLRFSGIPHVGFAYSFGSQGTQFVATNYEQGFRGNVMLNIDFKKNRSNGFLRSSNFDHNDVQLKLFKKGTVYSLDLKSSYQKSTVANNGGVSEDSLAGEFPLVFLPVRKESAELKTQLARIELNNYFDFNKDSISAIGLFTSHDLHTKNYRYLENGALPAVYPVINFDSASTYDQHQWSQFGNGLGVFSKGKRQLIQASLLAQYWNFQNLGNYFDTVEVDLNGRYQWRSKNIRLADDLSVNLLGAQQELSNDVGLTYYFDNFALKGMLLYKNTLPDYYQRYAIGNNYFPAEQIQKQQLADLRIGGSYTIGKQILELEYQLTTAQDNYWFIDSIWRNDTLNSMTYQSVQLSGTFKFGNWSISPNYIYTVNDKKAQIIPTHQLRTRILVKGGLFKAKKMIAYAGVDLSIQSSYSRIGYNAVNSTFRMNEISVSQNGWSNAHVFTGFQIEEFKFYLRIENFGYLWNDRNLEMMNDYPIPSTQFRLGITWDFFN